MENKQLITRAEITRGADTEELRLSVSSERPCEQWVYTLDGEHFGKVILSHAPDAIRGDWVKDGIALLDRHRGAIVARGLDCHIDGDKLVCDRIVWAAGDTAETLRENVNRGVVRDLSIECDYSPEDVKVVDDNTYRITRWTPLAAAFVTVPADPSVGVNRDFNVAQSAANNEPVVEVAERVATPTTGETITREKTKMNKDDSEGEALVNPTPVVESMVDHSAEITREECEQYSFIRAIRSLADRHAEPAKIERAVSDKLAKQLGRAPQGIWLPMTRGMNTTNAAGLVVTSQADDFISLLGARSLLNILGVKRFTGLRGNVSFPKATAGATAYWVNEGADVPESTPTIGQVVLTPHTVGVNIEISRTLLKQSSPSVEAEVREGIFRDVEAALQAALFQGTGADGQPMGILANTDVAAGVVASAAAPTFAEICGMAGTLDAYFADGGKWVVNNKVFGKLRGTRRFEDGGDRTIADIIAGEKYLADERAYTTAQLANGEAIYGKFDEVLLGLWGGVDIVADNTSANGALKLRGFQDCDIKLRHNEAFIKTTQF